MGRKVGVPNKFTASLRAAFETAFVDLQRQIPARGEKDFRLGAWAKAHPGDFYKLMARMVPQEISGPGGGAIPLGIEGKVLLYLPDNKRTTQEFNVTLKLPPRGGKAK